MEAFLGFIAITVKVIALFSAAIFVHEYGHYRMAKWCKMVVQGFAIGFGPKIVSWIVDGVEWSIRWIPAGGFVKLSQMLTSEAIEGRADPSVPAVSPAKRILVAFAGPAMNVAFAFVIATILYFIGLPVLQNDPIVGRVAPESPEGKAGLKAEDRIVAINGAPVKSWNDVYVEVLTARSNIVGVTYERAGSRTTIQLPTKTSEGLGGMKSLDIEPAERPVIARLAADKPAAKVGMKAEDKFISFDGVQVINQAHLIELVNKAKTRECDAVVERGQERITFKVAPIYDPEIKRYRIGIEFAGGHYVLQRPGPTPMEQFDEVFHLLGKTVSALWHSSETGVKASDMSGPVGILGSLAVEVKTDFRRALRFMVLLNLNLAILNLLPLPVLDGGHILMALYEVVTRRRVSIRFQEYATMTFAALLLSFMLYVTFFDVTRRLPLFKALLSQENVIEKAAPGTSGNPAPGANSPPPNPATAPGR